jgi:hypothetical protein
VGVGGAVPVLARTVRSVIRVTDEQSAFTIQSYQGIAHPQPASNERVDGGGTPRNRQARDTRVMPALHCQRTRLAQATARQAIHTRKALAHRRVIWHVRGKIVSSSLPPFSDARVDSLAPARSATA